EPGEEVPTRENLNAQREPDISLLHEVDVASGYVCDRPARFAVAVGRRARRAVTMYSRNEQGERGMRAKAWFPDALVEPGVQVLELCPADLPFGDFEYEVVVRAEDGIEERSKGLLNNVVHRRDSLSLAHSFVKGVDLFD